MRTLLIKISVTTFISLMLVACGDSNEGKMGKDTNQSKPGESSFRILSSKEDPGTFNAQFEQPIDFSFPFNDNEESSGSGTASLPVEDPTSEECIDASCSGWDDGVDDSVEGCTDIDAENYEPDATIYNNTCEYKKEGSTDDEESTCEEDINSCADWEAANAARYSEEAWCDVMTPGQCDGSKIGGYPMEGCTDSEAENYDPEATFDNETCEYVHGSESTDDGGANTDDGSTETEPEVLTCKTNIFMCADWDAARDAGYERVDWCNHAPEECQEDPGTTEVADPTLNGDDAPIEGCTDDAAENGACESLHVCENPAAPNFGEDGDCDCASLSSDWERKLDEILSFYVEYPIYSYMLRMRVSSVSAGDNNNEFNVSMHADWNIDLDPALGGMSIYNSQTLEGEYLDQGTFFALSEASMIVNGWKQDMEQKMEQKIEESNDAALFSSILWDVERNQQQSSNNTFNAAYFIVRFEEDECSQE